MPHFGGSIYHIFCRNLLILTDFYAIRTPIVWHVLGAYFFQIWGVGVVRIIFRKDGGVQKSMGHKVSCPNDGSFFFCPPHCGVNFR